MEQEHGNPHTVLRSGSLVHSIRLVQYLHDGRGYSDPLAIHIANSVRQYSVRTDRGPHGQVTSNTKDKRND